MRKEQLKQILGIVATVASTFDEDGISLRFMNNDFMQNNIRSVQEVDQIISNMRFAGMTPLGSALRSKVLDPVVVGPARAGRLQKPVLVITITDGQPAGEAQDAVAQGIRYAVDEVSRTPSHTPPKQGVRMDEQRGSPWTQLTTCNPTDEEAKFFNTYTPAFYIDYFKILAEVSKRDKMMSKEKNLEVMARFATMPAPKEEMEGKGKN